MLHSSTFASKRSRLDWAREVCVALLFGILIVTSTSQASSYMSPTLAPCPEWNLDSTPNDGTLGNILTSISAVSGNEVWASGYTIIEKTNLGQREKTLVMRWDGERWQIIPTPNPDDYANYLSSVIAFSSNDVWVSGTSGRGERPQPFLQHWNGQAWTSANLPALDPDGNELYALDGTGPNDVWAVGSVGCRGCQTEHSLVLHYNGIDWQSVPIDADGLADALFGISAISSTEVWFSGYQIEDNRTQPLAIRWTQSNGFEKTPIAKMVAGHRGVLNGIAAISPTDVWAAGYSLTNSGPNLYYDGLIYHFDGNYWSSVQSQLPDPSPEGSVLTAIDANGAQDVWAVGYFIASAAPRAFVIHYDGTKWTKLENPNPGEQAALYGADVQSNGDFFTAGYQVGKSGGGPSTTLVERYVDTCAILPTPAPTSTPPSSLPTPMPVGEIPGNNTRSFPETGKSVSGIFLDYWENNGGLAQQGYPISGIMGEISPLDGKTYTVQYFERAVFEYHPENQPPYNVLLSQLGTFRYKQKYVDGAPSQSPNNSADSLLFEQTGKRVGGKFLAYWQSNGGLAQQGYPISDEFREKSELDGKTYSVQYFERAVFELHIENEAPYDVLLSQLGTFRYKETYEQGTRQGSPTTTPTNPPASQPTQTTVAQGPCDGIPTGDPVIIYSPGQCLPKGQQLDVRVDAISGEQVSVAIYGPDSDKIYGAPFNVNAVRGVSFSLGTSDSYEAGLYKMVIIGVVSHQTAIGYFKTLP